MDVAFRWLLFSSQLVSTDAIIIGISSVEQLNQLIAVYKSAKQLPPEIVQAANEAYSACEKDNVKYFR